MKDNIFLIGIMGCGKSSLGKQLAKRLSMTFVDMDAVIEKEAGMTITQMFETFGEPYFRDKETELCRRLSKQTGLVISTGGGIVGREENMTVLGETGTIIFIDRNPSIIIRTINAEKRPLIRDNPQRLLDIHKQRLPLYRKYADRIVPNNRSFREAINRLMADITENSER